MSDQSRRLVLGAILAQLPLFSVRAFAQINAGDLLNRATGAQGMLGAGLSQGEIGSGLKDLLKVSSRKVVSQLSKPDGYYGDPAVRIPLPGQLERVRQPLSMVGASGMLDDLSLRMNRGAEKAAPKALNILTEAVSNITFDDARQILTGPQDSVTQYFRRSSTSQMTTEFTPIMGTALKGSGATRVMDSVRKKADGMPMLGALGQMGLGKMGMGQSGMTQSLMNLDLTGFAVGAALEGIFHYLGAQEADIRTNPAARSTSLLKKLFG
jgi:hypothetical protein